MDSQIFINCSKSVEHKGQHFASLASRNGKYKKKITSCYLLSDFLAM